MEKGENIYRNICRLCLKCDNRGKYVSLVENGKSNGISCYGLAVMKFAQISIEKDDKLPKYMCQKCLFLLKCAIYFKFKCENSEKVLKNWTEKHVNKTRKEANLNAKNYECMLFRQYFADEDFENTSEKDNFFENVKKFGGKQEHFGENEISNDSFFDSYLQSENDQDNVFENQNDVSKPKRKLNMLHKSSIFPKKKKKFKKNTEKDKYECEICKKILANPFTYRDHMQYHTGCRYICEHCGKGFPAKSRLNYHLVLLHGTGLYFPCRYCDHKSPTKLTLKEHERIHTGERPFTCDKCGLTFRRQTIWRNHMLHHSEKTVQCPQCPLKFYTIPDLKAHSNNIHERIYMYVCDVCNATYAKSTTVRKHLTEVHGILREMQGKITKINRVTCKGVAET